MWGVAAGIALLPLWTRPAPPGQLPGLATALNLDASGPMRFVAGLMVLPVIFPLVLQPVIRRLAAGQAWAVRGAAGAMVAALWLSLIDQNVVWVVIPTAIALLVCTLLRNAEAQFMRRDFILIPTAVTVFIALMDVASALDFAEQVLVAAMLTLAVRLAMVFVPGPLQQGFAFLLAPLGLALQTPFFSYDQRHLGWPSLVIALLTPFVLRPLLRDWRRAAWLLTWVVYPIALYSYMTATSLASAEGKPRVNFFEDAHGLMPASEMMRGERPYRDVLPAHGLIEDGLLDYVTIRLRGADIGTVLKGRAVAGSLNAIAIYALAVAMTGVAEAGVLAFLFAAMFGITPHIFRFVPALVALVFIAAAVRLKRPRLLAGAGASVAIALLTSLDFGAYAAVTLAIAIMRFGRERLRAMGNAALGIAAVSIPFLIALTAFGILGPFFTTTLFEVPSFAPAYALNQYTPPPAFKTFRFFPEILLGIFDKLAALVLLWIAAVIFVAVTLPQRVRRRTEPLLLVAVFIAVAGISYAERHHLHFQFALAPLIIAATWLLIRRRSPFAPAVVLVLLVMAHITTHLLVISMLHQARGPLDSGWVEIADVPRARGAFFTSSDGAMVGSVKKFIDQNLRGDETFFDFTNRGILYFLFNRNCPVRQYEVAFYETEERQRQVIAAIESNPRVRAALVPSGPSDNTGVDNIANQIRAPLVWAYLQQHFQPSFQEGIVVFWMRK
jgi:hypothetical protein